MTVRSAVFVNVDKVDEMMTVVWVATVWVVMGKNAEVEPWEMVTKEGVLAAAEFDDRVIVTPPDGAAEVMVTVPVTDVDEPPLTVDGLMVRFPMVGPIVEVVRSPPPPPQPSTQNAANKVKMVQRVT